jgi:hypothetical protein
MGNALWGNMRKDNILFYFQYAWKFTFFTPNSKQCINLVILCNTTGVCKLIMAKYSDCTVADSHSYACKWKQPPKCMKKTRMCKMRPTEKTAGLIQYQASQIDSWKKHQWIYVNYWYCQLSAIIVEAMHSNIAHT